MKKMPFVQYIFRWSPTILWLIAEIFALKAVLPSKLGNAFAVLSMVTLAESLFLQIIAISSGLKVHVSIKRLFLLKSSTDSVLFILLIGMLNVPLIDQLASDNEKLREAFFCWQTLFDGLILLHSIQNRRVSKTRPVDSLKPT